MTFRELKAAVRENVFTTGEAPNHVKPHDKFFVDCLIDLQTVVKCMQEGNTDIFPQCATLYQCGLTVIQKPKGPIMSVAIVDRINPDTGEEDADSDTDYCSRITYRQVDACYIKRYLEIGNSCGTCPSITLFFGIPPVPTDEGVPAGLPPLQLGFHYPQESTDRTWGRAGGGVWAIMQGRIYIAPWIQSTESVEVVWDGIKSHWSDDDSIDDDPLLQEAVEEYIRWKHADRYSKEVDEMIRAEQAYGVARLKLLHQCRQETMVRGCDGSGNVSQARGMGTGGGILYYNDTAGVGQADCPDGYTGDRVTVTLAVGTVSSSKSVADANERAQIEAQEQAESRLDCERQAVTYLSEEVIGTASCTREPGAPVPSGQDQVVVLPAGAVTSTESVQDATDRAQAQANDAAAAQLSCTYYNRAITVTAVCPDNNAITAEGKVAEKEYSADTQGQADALAEAEATVRAWAALDALGTCGGGGTVYYLNQEQAGIYQYFCRSWGAIGQINLAWHIAAGRYPGETQDLANLAAKMFATGMCEKKARQLCQQQQIGTFEYEIP